MTAANRGISGLFNKESVDKNASAAADAAVAEADSADADSAADAAAGVASSEEAGGVTQAEGGEGGATETASLPPSRPSGGNLRASMTSMEMPASSRGDIRTRSSSFASYSPPPAPTMAPPPRPAPPALPSRSESNSTEAVIAVEASVDAATPQAPMPGANSGNGSDDSGDALPDVALPTKDTPLAPSQTAAAAAAAVDSGPIGKAGDWSLIKNRKGAEYWYNTDTKETSFTKPTSVNAAEESNRGEAEKEAAATAAAAAADKTVPTATVLESPGGSDISEGMPQGWAARIDENTGTTYYFNETSKETSWVLPPSEAALEVTLSGDYAGGGGLASSPDLPQGWAARIDEKTGATYYFNETSKETSWVPPPSDAALEVALSGDYAGGGGLASSPDLPQGWAARIDEKTGATYYINETSKETSWVLPSSEAAEVNGRKGETLVEEATTPLASANEAPENTDSSAMDL